jgi:ubiquinol-cytochrome c reductase cytochrome b subunit
LSSEDKPPQPESNSENGRSRPGLLERLWKWTDQRTGADKILHQSLDEPIPGGARFAYVFGSALLFIFVSQVVTGLCLALYYAPSPITAHASVAYIVKDVAAGAFLRSLHSYGSSAMLVVLVMHFLQTFLYGSYKGKRELLWISGCTLSLLVLGMTFTGYLLSWDQRAYSAGSVGTDIAGQVPLIGESLRLLLRGGATMGALTLSRFYVLHVFIIPALIFSLVAAHVFLFRKAGAAGPVSEDPVNPRLAPEMFYPKQVLIDMAFVLLVMGFLGMMAHFFPVTLGLQADPTNTSYLPRPEWYYLPMFQWLKYWQGWSTVIGAFFIPVILIGLVFMLPFMDRGAERRPWRRPIPVGGVFIVLIGLLWLGMSSRLEDSRDPTVAAQIAEQNRQEDVYFHSAFQPYSPSSPSGGDTSTPLNVIAAQGKGIFDSHGCSGCHGASGGGAIGPPLTHISSKYPPAQLSALLKAPTPPMKTAGMVALTLNNDEMKGLVSYLTSLGGTSTAPAEAPATSGSSSPTPGGAQVAAIPGAPSGGTGSPAASADAVPGKAVFDSNRCSGCHGSNGGGGVGPALTHISSQYPPAKLTALLKAPTAKMKAAGMVPLTLKSADMKALVSYVSGLGGPPAAPEAALPASDAAPLASLAPAKVAPVAAAAPTKATAAAAPPADGTAAPATTTTKPGAPATTPKAAAGSSAVTAAANVQGKGLFKSQRCSGCHGATGGGGVGPALTHISTQFPPAKLTALLKAPTAKMKAGGMVPLTLKSAGMKSLISYLTSLGGTPAPPATPTPDTAAAPAAAPPPAASQPAASAPPASPSPADAAATPSKAGTKTPAVSASASTGKGVFDANRCSGCHGASGGGGTGPALTHISTQYPPAQLEALLKTPNAKMKAGGMVDLTLNDADMKALVSYVTSLGGAPAASAAVPSPTAATPPVAGAAPVAAAVLGMNKLETKGQLVFKAHRCADCHGTAGVGGTAAAAGLAGMGKGYLPAALTTMLQHPTSEMQKGGMPPISLDGDDMKALVAYVSNISGPRSKVH